MGVKDLDFSNIEQQGSEDSAPNRKLSGIDLVSVGVAAVALGEDELVNAVGSMIYDRAKEGVYYLGEGARQLYENIGQLTTQAEEFIGTSPEGATEQVEASVATGRKERKAELEAQFGAPGIEAKTGMVVGKNAPLFAIPITKVPGLAKSTVGKLYPKATQLFNTLFGSATVGGVTAGLMDAENAEARIDNMKTGTLWGLGGASALETFKYLGHGVRFVKSPYIDRLKEKFGKEGMRLSREVGPLKPSEKTGSIFLQDLEEVSASVAKGAELNRSFVNRQLTSAFKFFKRAGHKISKIKESDFGGRIEKTFHNTVDKILDHRKANADKLFGEANKITQGKKIVGTENVRREIRKILDETNLPGSKTGGNKELRNELMAVLDDFRPPSQKTVAPVARTVAGEKGQMVLRGKTITQEIPAGEFNMINAEKTGKLLSDWGASAQGKGGLFIQLDKAQQTRYARRLYEAMKKDSDAVPALAAARAQYKADSVMLDEIKDSALGALFGKTKAPNIDQIADAFQRMNPASIKSSMSILQRTDPEIHKGLQRWWINRALNKAAAPDVRAENFGIDADKIISSLMKGEGKKTFNAIFNDTKSRKMVMDGIGYIRRINPKAVHQAKRFMSTGKEVAGELASKSPTFAARIAASVGATRIFRNALLTEKGIKALETISKSSVSPQRAAQALATMTAIYVTHNGEPEDTVEDTSVDALDFTGL